MYVNFYAEVTTMIQDQTNCITCGGVYVQHGNRWKCRHCGNFKPMLQLGDNETLLAIAFQKLREQNFVDAEQDIDDIIQRAPTLPLGYWGSVCARYGIKYERDFTGQMIPTCCMPSIESFSNDGHFKKAVEYADAETAEWYRSQAE